MSQSSNGLAVNVSPMSALLAKRVPLADVELGRRGNVFVAPRLGASV